MVCVRKRKPFMPKPASTSTKYQKRRYQKRSEKILTPQITSAIVMQRRILDQFRAKRLLKGVFLEGITSFGGPAPDNAPG